VTETAKTVKVVLLDGREINVLPQKAARIVRRGRGRLAAVKMPPERAVMPNPEKR